MRPDPIVRRALVWLLAAAGYYAVAWLSGRAGVARDGVPLIAFGTGIAYAAVQLGGPWLASSAAAGAVALGLTDGLPAGSTALLAAAAAAAGLTGWTFVRSSRPPDAGGKISDTVVRTAAAAAAGAISGTFVLGANAAAGRASTLSDWFVVALVSTAGIVVVAPAVRASLHRSARGVAHGWEWSAVLAATIAVSLCVDFAVPDRFGPAAYVVIPLVVWAALRCGRVGTSFAIVAVAVIAAATASTGHGPFAVPDADRTAVGLNAYLIVVALTGLLVVGLVEVQGHAARGRNEAEERHRALIDSLPLVTYRRALGDFDGPPSFESRQVEALLGYPVERWLAEPRFASTLVHPDDRELNAELNARSQSEDVVQGEYRMIRADGRVVWVLDHMYVERDASGAAVAQQGFVIDISERKALEEQLGRAQRLEALGLLAGGIAHDFNNLLTAISGYAGLALEHGGKDDERIRSDLAEVRTAAGRAADLTRQLLAFGRRQVLERVVVDLNEIVIEARSLLQRVIGEQVAIVTTLDPDLPRVHADTNQLGQVLVNLAINARDAMPDGGTLTIETLSDNGDAVLLVSDTGHGMDEQTRARIFEPFFSTKPVGEGTGLGLAMVHGIVKQTGGNVTAESAPGAGASFRIVLPGTDEVPAAGAVPVEARPRGSERVLLVEDEDIVRLLVVEMLEGQGYEVVSASGPTEALEVDEPFDLLLSDVVMPSMSGPELAERLTQRWLGIGVLFISGYSAAAVADRETLIGDLLEKPFTIEQLSAKVREALDARRPVAPVG